MNGAEMNRIRGVGLELLTELENLVVDGAGGEVETHPPNIVQQLFARDSPAWIIEEVAEKLELMRRQGNECAGSIDLHFEKVDGDVSEISRQLFNLLLCAPDCGLNTRKQLARAEGLGHVIICAGLEQQNLVCHFRNPAQHNNRG